MCTIICLESFSYNERGLSGALHRDTTTTLRRGFRASSHVNESFEVRYRRAINHSRANPCGIINAIKYRLRASIISLVRFNARTLLVALILFVDERIVRAHIHTHVHTEAFVEHQFQFFSSCFRVVLGFFLSVP